MQEQDKSIVIEDLTAYNENDAPFSFHRALLKLFYVAKVENKNDSKVKPDGTIYEKWKLSKTSLTNIAACRITTLYFLVLLGFSVPRFCLTHIRHPAYDGVYRIGITFLNSSDHFAFNYILYFSGIFIGAILLKICYMIMSPKGIHIKNKEAIIKNTILYNGCSFLSNNIGNDMKPENTSPKFTARESMPSQSVTNETIVQQPRPLTLSLPTSPIGDVIADCQHRRSATWAPSLTPVNVPRLETFFCVQGVFNFDKSDVGC